MTDATAEVNFQVCSTRQLKIPHGKVLRFLYRGEVRSKLFEKSDKRKVRVKESARKTYRIYGLCIGAARTETRDRRPNSENAKCFYRIFYFAFDQGCAGIALSLGLSNPSIREGGRRGYFGTDFFLPLFPPSSLSAVRPSSPIGIRRGKNFSRSVRYDLVSEGRKNLASERADVL